MIIDFAKWPTTQLVSSNWPLMVLMVVGSFLLPRGVQAATNCTTGPKSSLTTDSGVTFNLDKAYTCGQYLDGNFWILAPSGASVVSMTPAFNASAENNGYEINPTLVNNQHPWRTSLDGSLCDRVSAGRCLWKNPPALPLAVSPGDSLVKVISGPDEYEGGTCSGPGKGRCIATGAVLTVVNANPTASCSQPFRPPLAGSQKPAFCADGLMSAIDTRLPKHAALSSGQGPWSISYANGVFKSMGNGTFWNDLCTDSSLASNNCIPNDALDAQQGDTSTSSQGYGSPRAMAITGAMAVTMQTGSAAAKYPIVWKVVQIGIDAWGARKAGKCWFPDGGIHNGWKAPILYAGHMLDSTTLLSAATGKDECFQEDGHTYESTIQPGLYLWGRETGCLKSDGDAVGAKQTRWCSGNKNDNRDGGAQWTSTCGGTKNTMQPTPAQQISQGCYSLTSYQQHTHNYLGQVAVVRNLLGSDREQTWGHRPFFAVWDRIGAPPWNGACTSYCSNFLKNFYLAYGKPNGSPQPPPTPRLPAPALQ